MALGTLGGWLSFALALIAGVALVIWPDHKWIAWAVFAGASICAVCSIAYYLWSNYNFVWPLQSKKSALPFKNPNFSADYRPVVKQGQRFVNQRVLLDGFYYYKCTFENVTFIYNGVTPLKFSGNTISGTMAFGSDNPSVQSAFTLFYVFRLIKEDMRFSIENSVHSHIEPIRHQDQK